MLLMLSSMFFFWPLLCLILNSCNLVSYGMSCFAVIVALLFFFFLTFQFAEWCCEYGKHGCRTPDRPYSMFEGNISVWLVERCLHMIAVYPSDTDPYIYLMPHYLLRHNSRHMYTHMHERERERDLPVHACLIIHVYLLRNELVSYMSTSWETNPCV